MGGKEEGEDWRLEVYGSASAGFSLRHSDIDLVLLTRSKTLTLSHIYYLLSVQPWPITPKLLPQAQIPLITTKLNLHSSPLAKKMLSSKQLKRLE